MEDEWVRIPTLDEKEDCLGPGHCCQDREKKADIKKTSIEAKSHCLDKEK